MRLLPFLFLLLSNVLAAQTFGEPLVFPNNTMGHPFSIESGPDGSLYVAGTFRDTITFSLNGQDSSWYRSQPTAFVARYDDNEEMAWIRLAEGGDTRAYDVHLSTEGKLYVVGRFDGIITLGDGFTGNSGAEPDGFVWQLTEAGTVTDFRAYRAFIAEGAASHVTTDPAGNIYIAGTYDKEMDVDLDPTPGSLVLLQSPIGDDIFVTKYSPDFDLEWAESLGVDSDDIAVRGLLADATGHAYVVGEFDNGIDFDDDEIASAGDLDFFIAKHHPTNNNWLWYQTFGGSEDDLVQDVIFSDGSQEELLLSGYYEGEFIYDTTTLSLNAGTERAGFLIRHSTDGSPLAARSLDAGADVRLYDLALAENGAPLVLGSFSGTLPLADGGNHTTDSTFAVFVSQVSVELTLVNALSCAEGIRFDRSFFPATIWPELARQSDGELVISGLTYGDASVGNGTPVRPLQIDFVSTIPNFILRIAAFPLSAIGEVANEARQPLILYPNPGRGDIFIQTAGPVYDLRLVDQRGEVLRSHSGPAPKRWDPGPLPAGIYWLTGRTDRGTFVRPYVRKP